MTGRRPYAVAARRPARDRPGAATGNKAPGRTGGGPARRLVAVWSQAAGPAPRTTVAVWDWPDWSVQLMLILLPGW